MEDYEYDAKKSNLLELFSKGIDKYIPQGKVVELYDLLKDEETRDIGISLDIMFDMLKMLVERTGDK